MTTLVRLAIGLLASSSLLLAAAKPKECPTAFVEQYSDGLCNTKGWVQSPVYLKRLTGFNTSISCGSACLKRPDCKSFRFRVDGGKCDLYSRYLNDEAMNFDPDNYQPGRFYNRDCYSTDCHVIKACRAINLCDPEECDDPNYCYTTYTRYACGFGETANLDQYHRKKIRRTFLDGMYTACEAARECASNARYGPFDVFYHFPSKKWICVGRKFFPYDYDVGPLDPQDQHINRNTLSVKNQSVGFSYGYYVSDYYYD